MKAGILYDAKNIRLGEAPNPTIRPDEVLLESKAAGICGTDLHIYRGEFVGRVSYPAIQGHEFGGVIVEVGSEVRGYKVGDRVVVDPIISCHSCPACLTGHINACRTLKLLGVDLDGGYGQYVAVPASHLFPLPDAVPMNQAPMVEMYALGHHILQRERDSARGNGSHPRFREIGPLHSGCALPQRQPRSHHRHGFAAFPPGNRRKVRH